MKGHACDRLMGTPDSRHSLSGGPSKRTKVFVQYSYLSDGGEEERLWFDDASERPSNHVLGIFGIMHPIIFRLVYYSWTRGSGLWLFAIRFVIS